MDTALGATVQPTAVTLGKWPHFCALFSCAHLLNGADASAHLRGCCGNSVGHHVQEGLSPGPCTVHGGCFLSLFPKLYAYKGILRSNKGYFYVDCFWGVEGMFMQTRRTNINRIKDGEKVSVLPCCLSLRLSSLLPVTRMGS